MVSSHSLLGTIIFLFKLVDKSNKLYLQCENLYLSKSARQWTCQAVAEASNGAKKYHNINPCQFVHGQLALQKKNFLNLKFTMIFASLSFKMTYWYLEMVLFPKLQCIHLGPVVQSIVSLKSSLRGQLLRLCNQKH